MSRFLTPLDMRDNEGVADEKWILLAPLMYESDVAGRVITVPAGFPTDLASVPRLPIVYGLCGGVARRAAVVHDYLYTSGRASRSVADAVFREASAAIGVPAWRRWLMWAGVRVGGSSHYAPERTGVDPAIEW
ncbi:DUF1353 domain-containing protein [Massilia sp. CMS3.1]|uniref:DUF1353 domain-containing protein n=1 Tax=Massilia sp. CMS3.1 TaxID=3373083 RepID=UPI003EE54BD6